MRFPYRSNPPWPHERNGGGGPEILDAVSGRFFPEVFAAEGPFGPVDSRERGHLDLDGDLHELTPDVVTKPPLT